MHTDSFIPWPCYGNLTNCGFVSIWTSYEIIQIHNNKDSDLSVLNTIHSIYFVQNRCAAWRISQFSLEFFCCTCTLWYCLVISLFLALDRNEYNYIKHYNFIAISQSAIFRIGSSHFIYLFILFVCSEFTVHFLFRSYII